MMMNNHEADEQIIGYLYRTLSDAEREARGIEFLPQNLIEAVGAFAGDPFVEQVLGTLTYREREIIKLRYGLGDGYTYTLEEVGKIFRVTRERVRQIESKALRKIRRQMANIVKVLEL